MIAVDNVLISNEVVEAHFVCDLVKCKGGCCEEGDAGAPLEEAELDIIEDAYEKVKHLLPPAAIAEIERNGKYVFHEEFGYCTPTLASDNEICVYAMRDNKGIIKCAFEQVYNEGGLAWKKPISCHLYPIIQKNGKNGTFDRMNYEPREVLCKPACGLGKKLKVPVYQFLKEPIVRKYGEDFYNALNQVAKDYFSVRNGK